jgi:hypothetical protein
MKPKSETASSAKLTASRVSDSIKSEECDAKPSPQQRKKEKIVERVRELSGTTFPFFMAEAVHDAARTGMRVTDKEEEEAKGYHVHCSSEYHFARMTGKGVHLVPLLYSVSLRIAKDSKNFHVSMQSISHFLGLTESDDTAYFAASLLVASGFWIPTERKLGKAAKYRPLTHSAWIEKCGTEDWWDTAKQEYVKVGKYCTVKAQFPFNEASEERIVGQKLFGITGETFFPGVLKGWLKLGSMEELQSWAKDFMSEDAGGDDGMTRRIRLGEYFRAMSARTK